MYNTPQIITVHAESISLDDPCLFWAHSPDNHFISSMEKYGQIEPVLVMAVADQKILVAGYKRVKALKALKRKIMALVLPVADPYLKGQIYLLSNTGQNLDMKKTVLALRYFSSIGRISEEILTNLHLVPGSKLEQLWQSWISIPCSWDTLLAKGNISLECARIMQNLKAEDLEAVYPFFDQLSWSRSSSLNFLTWLGETARMKKAGICRLIHELELAPILQSRLSPGDKIKKIMLVVFQARYPVLSSLKGSLTRKLRQIGAKSGWKVEHLDDYESRELVFSTRVKNIQDLQKALRGLEQISSSKALENWPVK